jgi:hypothetical protein
LIHYSTYVFLRNLHQWEHNNRGGAGWCGRTRYARDVLS